MIRIGLCGGIGSGKSYAGKLFEKAGIPRLDTDAVSREVCRPGTPCLAELCRAFGEGILCPDGSLDRPALAARVFSDEAARLTLNRITHRYILDECRAFFAACEKAGNEAALIEAPLLHESGFDRECDVVYAVIADHDTRVKRILKRDGGTPEEAEARIARQKTDEWLAAHSDGVLLNGAGDCIEKEVSGAVCRLLPTHISKQ